jgi:predicted nucleic acid-binding protein
MTFVLDASVTVVWGLNDEEDAIADLAWQRLVVEQALVPAIWWFEIRNVLLANERRQRISERETTSFLRSLAAMDIEIDRAPAEAAILTLARSHRLTAYDASYLELAMRRDQPLATLDKSLAAAAKREGVLLIGPQESA